MATPISERGRLLPPDLDDRRWTDLVAEARALIPQYAPQWTDHNPSDLGITLVELFAWLVEGMIYRLNRVPEKNYVAFLGLLGITRDPATPARAFLTFTANPAGGPVTVPKGKQAQTQEREGETPVVFETDAAVTVLPANLKAAVLIGKLFGNKYSNASTRLVAPPAPGFDVGAAGGFSTTLCLGFDALPGQDVRLLLDLSRPVRLGAGAIPEMQVEWLYSSGAAEPTTWTPIPLVADGTEGLQRSGTVVITPPATWASQNPATAWPGIPPVAAADTVNVAYWWIGIRLSNLTAGPVQVGIRSVLFNAVSATNALTAAGESATGTGAANQIVALAHQPVFKRLETDTPYDHLTVTVAGAPWTRVDDLRAGVHDAWLLEPVAGEIRFGDYSTLNPTGHGTIPPAGAAIAIAPYRYVAGGASGNVGAGTITSLRTPVAGIIGVTNLVSAFGGSDEEPIEETKRRAPRLLRTRDRAVTSEDYEYLAREATTDVKIVRCLEPRVHDTTTAAWSKGDPWTFGALDRAPGNVHVIVVPDQGDGEPRPEPSVDLVHEVLRYLDKRRDLTARLHVTGPRYLPIVVTATLGVWQRAIDGGLTTVADAKNAMVARIRRYLHPVHGGLDGEGWQVGQHVFVADLYKAAMPAEEIGYISSLSLSAESPPAYHQPPIGPGGAWDPNERPFTLAAAATAVRVADYELVCDATGTHAVTASAIA